MKIVFSNDDGYNAIGIQSLYRAFSDIQDIAMCAPYRQKSAFSHAINYYDYFLVKELSGEFKGYALDSTPADCVRATFHGLLSKPNLVLSGINYGLNIAQDVFYSGTVGAAREACLSGVLGIAFSVDVDDFTDPDAKATVEVFDYAAQVSRKIVDALPESVLQWKDTVINVNFPQIYPAKGIKLTILGQNRYATKLDFKEEKGESFVKILTTEVSSESISNSDSDCIEKGFVSVSVLYKGCKDDSEKLAELSFLEKLDINL